MYRAVSNTPAGHDSLIRLHEHFGGRLADVLADVVEDASPEFSSPDVLDLVVWNVLVGYVVNIAASATYPMISKLLSSQGRLDKDALAQVGAELDAPVPPLPHDAAARERIVAVLAQYGVPAGEQEEAADRVLGVLEPVARP